MKLSDFDFELPEALIALRPARPRPASRLLVARGDAFTDATVADLPAFLRAGDLLVFNNTKVIPARLTGIRRRETPHGSGEARIEVTLIQKSSDQWRALAKPAKRLAPGDRITFADGFDAMVTEKAEGGEIGLRFDADADALEQALDAVGQVPLPPYIATRRAADAQDRTDYQTVFAQTPGAVAAPTASLHFDADLLARLATAGVRSTHVTLHVGAGTFLPVKVDDISLHKMHSEWGEVTDTAATEIMETIRAGGRVIPVGTTALRLIETAATAPRQIAPWTGDTDIFITPGYTFRITDGLMTNFHLPKSTLLMLVSALMGRDCIRQVYDHAISNRYRFFSYGDSSLLLPDR